MRYLMVISGVASFGMAFLGASSMRSDIQLILVVLGATAGMILFGIAAILNKLDR